MLKFHGMDANVDILCPEVEVCCEITLLDQILQLTIQERIKL